MALTSAKLNITFSLDSSPKEFVFTDTTDYASQSVALADITGSIKVTAPSGVTYAGQPDDIDGSVGRINQNNIYVPLLSDGTPEVGDYTFEYTATDGSDTVVYTKTVNFQYTKPVTSIQSTYDCLSPLVSTEDATNYLYGAINPVDRFNLVAADSVANTFSIAGEKSGFVRVGDTFSIISSTGNNGDYTVTSVSYDGATDRTVLGVANVSDNTADGSLVTRKAQIFYPQVLGLNPVVGYSKELQTSVFYTKTHEFKYEVKNFWDLTDGVSIVDSFEDSNEIDIECDVRLCDVFCCINSKFNEYLSLKCKNNTLANIALEQYVLATSHLAALRQAFECGKSQAVTDLTNQIKEVTQCNDDCSCSDTEPVLVTGLGGGNNVVVQSSGNGVNVASVTAGDTTTYTLSLDQSILDDIANANATSSVVSTDGSVSVSSSTAGSNTEYDLSVTIPGSPKELMSFRVKIDIDNTTSTRTIVASDVVIQNETNLQTPTVSFVSLVSDPSYEIFKARINDFQISANNTYKTLVSPYFVERKTISGTIDSSDVTSTFQDYIDPVVAELKAGEFDLVFNRILSDDFLRNGNVFLEQQGISKIYFNVQIIE